MKHMIRVAAVILFAAALQAFAQNNWPQWGQNPQHQGFVDVVGQSLHSRLANITYDRFVPDEQQDQGGSLLAHYQATILHQEDAYMMFKSGTYTLDDGINTATHWNSQIWNEKRLHWEGGQLVEKWTFASDWKPEPADLVGGWEPVFHAALANDFIYVPGANGTVWKLDTGDGSVVSLINPGYNAAAGTTVYVAGPLSADNNGNIFFNALQLNFDPNTSAGDESTVNSWLVRIAPNDSSSKVSYATLVTNQPTLCVRAVNNNYLPWPGVTNLNDGHDTTSPYDPNFIRGSRPCGPQRPGINVAPAIALDGTIYTVSTADSNSRYSYVVAVNPDLTHKWQASLRDRGINDGCGVTIPLATQTNPVQKGHCRWGTYDANHLGVDPATNQMPAGRVIDQSSSSPTVLPDGSVLYGAYSRYNVSRGHLFRFSSTGSFISWYDFGWDSTPAVWPHNGTFSVVIKDNHYDEEEGFYCNNFQGNPAVANIVCDCDQCHDPVGVPAGPFYITQLSGTQQDSSNHHMFAEWKFQSTNTMSCVGDEQPQHCTVDHPHGFEWCINAPAVDGNGVVYNNSEDGRLYALPQGHTGVWHDGSPGGPAATHFFTNLALGAAYTPLSIDAQGRIFTQNDGHLFVIGD